MRRHKHAVLTIMCLHHKTEKTIMLSQTHNLVWGEAAWFMLITALVFDVSPTIALFVLLTVVDFVGIPDMMFHAVIVYALASGIVNRKWGQVLWAVCAVGYMQRLSELRELTDPNPSNSGRGRSRGSVHVCLRDSHPTRGVAPRPGRTSRDMLQAVLGAVNCYEDRLVEEVGRLSGTSQASHTLGL